MRYDSKAILKAYKDQYGIEQDFGFLRDPVIVNSVFFKKPKRIEVLGLILPNILFKSVSLTLQDFGQNPKNRLGGKLGFIAILHFWLSGDKHPLTLVPTFVFGVIKHFIGRFNEGGRGKAILWYGSGATDTDGKQKI